MLRICFDPSEDFTITFPGGELFKQGSRIEAKEGDDVLVERSVVIKFAVSAHDGGATFVQHAWEGDVAAPATTRAARRTLPKVGRGDSC
jgi:hypothetical protein